MASEFESEQSEDKNSVTGGDRERGRQPAKGRIVIRTIVGFARLAKAHVVSFCALAWPGAALGSIVVFMAFNSYAALCARTGLGSAADVAIGTVLGLFAIVLAGLIVIVIVVILRRVPSFFSAVLLGVLMCMLALGRLFGLSYEMMMRVASAPILLFLCLGAAVSIMARRGHRRATTRGYVIVSVIMLTVAITGVAALLYWLASPGRDSFLITESPLAEYRAPRLDVPNPAEKGSYEVGILCYGSGSDKHRPEYGELVELKTESADASPFVENLKGFKAKFRKWYWGFGPKEFPLNGRVWYPKDEGPFALVLVVHGNHQMEEHSDPGYGYLGELLASRGFIMVSVDENFLNISWSGDIGSENDARGWILLKHLSLWRDWNEAEGNPFYGKVDLSNIALVGHSRGGEAIMHAAAFNMLEHYPDDANVRFDFGFEIKSLVGIAPIDGQYKPAGQHVPIENVNYLVLQGSHDSDLDFFAGSRCFRRVKFTDGRYWMKTSLYIYRANHGQFNTVWGKYDVPPLRHLLNIAPLLRGEEQRLIAKTYICAFLEATLHGDKRYIPMFRDHRVIADWLPETIYFGRFEDSKFRVVSNFDDCIDITKATVSGGVQRARNLSTWRLQEMKGRGGWPFRDYAVVLGWNDPGKTDNDNDAAFTLTLPDDLAQSWRLNKKSILVFSLADTEEEPKKQNRSSSENSSQGSVEMDDNARVSQSHPPNANSNDLTQTTYKGSGEKEPIDLTIELTSADGYRAAIPLSEFFPIQPVLKVQFTKWDYWERTRYKSHTEPVLQTFEIPLSAFVQANPSFNPARLKMIEFRFDRTKSGVVILDQVGFTNRL